MTEQVVVTVWCTDGIHITHALPPGAPTSLVEAITDGHVWLGIDDAAGVTHLYRSANITRITITGLPR